MRQLLPILALLSASTGPASAQSPEFAAKVAAFAQEPAPSSAELQTGARDIEAQLSRRDGSACVPEAVRVEEPRSALADRLILAGLLQGKFVGGWTFYGTPLGCHLERTRYFAIRQADRSLVVRRMVRGETLASLSLLMDARPQAQLVLGRALARAAPGCAPDTLYFSRARVILREPGLAPDWNGVRLKGAWRELWTFLGCGKQIDVPMRFTADGQGGAIVEATDTGLQVRDG